MRTLVCWLYVCLVASAAVARADISPSPTSSPTGRQDVADAWWTGPLLAPSAGTLPRGHVLVEPYLFDVIQYGAYDRHGSLTPVTHANNFGSLTYVIYGVTDRFNVGAIPVFGYTTVTGGLPSSSVRLGDWALLAQYRLTPYRAGSSTPTISINLQETFPTGKYDNLGARSSDGQGSGAYSTRVALYMQSYLWMRNGRILRARLNLSDSFSSTVPVSGVSVYGTQTGFSGHAYPGNTFVANAATEYSITRSWVFANDFVYTYNANTRLASNTGTTVNLGDSHSCAIAPAIEYNWSPNVGVIAGVRFFPSGINSSASVTPAIAINYVH